MISNFLMCLGYVPNDGNKNSKLYDSWACDVSFFVVYFLSHPSVNLLWKFPPEGDGICLFLFPEVPMTNQGMIDYTGVHSGEQSLLSFSFLTEQWVRSLKSSHTGRSWMRNHACVDGAPVPSLSLPFYICTLAPPGGHVQSHSLLR